MAHQAQSPALCCSVLFCCLRCCRLFAPTSCHHKKKRSQTSSTHRESPVAPSATGIAVQSGNIFRVSPFETMVRTLIDILQIASCNVKTFLTDSSP